MVNAVNEHAQPGPPPVPARPQRYEAAGDAPTRRRFWLHPMSGLLILGVDWLFFAPEAATAQTALIVTVPPAFLAAGSGTFWIQRRRNGDTIRAALLKGLVGGVLAAVPTPISGTVFGTLVLVLSGLSNWNQREK